MKWILIIPALVLVGCGGGGTTPGEIPVFNAPQIVDGVYSGVAKENDARTGDIPMTVTISSTGIRYDVLGFPSVYCPRDWQCTTTLDGEPAQFQLQKAETGYKGYIYREGFNWNTRVYSAWRRFDVQ